RGVEHPFRTGFEAVFGAQQLPVKTRTAPGIRGMPSAPARTSGGSRPRSAFPATDASARQGGVPDLEGTRGIHPHRPRRSASRPAVVVAPNDRTAANVLSPPGYRIRQEGWKKAAIRLTVLTPVTSTSRVSTRGHLKAAQMF